MCVKRKHACMNAAPTGQKAFCIMMWIWIMRMSCFAREHFRLQLSALTIGSCQLGF